MSAHTDKTACWLGLMGSLAPMTQLTGTPTTTRANKANRVKPYRPLFPNYLPLGFLFQLRTDLVIVEFDPIIQTWPIAQDLSFFPECGFFLQILLAAMKLSPSPHLFFFNVDIIAIHICQWPPEGKLWSEVEIILQRCLVLYLISIFPLFSFIFELLASVPSFLPCRHAAWCLSTCLHESKARATNYSWLQKYWPVMVGPACGLARRRWSKSRRREKATVKTGFKHCVMIDTFFFFF